MVTVAEYLMHIVNSSWVTDYFAALPCVTHK